MRLSNKQISELKTLFELVHGSILSNEQAQAEGLAIMRLVYVKELRKHQLNNGENSNEGLKEKAHSTKQIGQQ